MSVRTFLGQGLCIVNLFCVEDLDCLSSASAHKVFYGRTSVLALLCWSLSYACSTSCFHVVMFWAILCNFCVIQFVATYRNWCWRLSAVSILLRSLFQQRVLCKFGFVLCANCVSRLCSSSAPRMMQCRVCGPECLSFESSVLYMLTATTVRCFVCVHWNIECVSLASQYWAQCKNQQSRKSQVLRCLKCAEYLSKLMVILAFPENPAGLDDDGFDDGFAFSGSTKLQS